MLHLKTPESRYLRPALSQPETLTHDQIRGFLHSCSMPCTLVECTLLAACRLGGI